MTIIKKNHIIDSSTKIIFLNWTKTLKIQTLDINLEMGRASKIAGYFFGIIIVLFGFFWIAATMSMPAIFAGDYILIGLIIVIGGFVIIYLGHRSGGKKQELQPK